MSVEPLRPPAPEVATVVQTLRDAFDEGPHDPSPRGGLPGDYPRSGRAFFVQAGYKF